MFLKVVLERWGWVMWLAEGGAVVVGGMEGRRWW